MIRLNFSSLGSVNCHIKEMRRCVKEKIFEKLFPEKTLIGDDLRLQWDLLKREKLRRLQIVFGLFTTLATLLHFLLVDYQVKQDFWFWLSFRLSLISLCVIQMLFLRSHSYSKLKYPRIPTFVVCTYLILTQLYVTGWTVEITNYSYTISPLWVFMYLFCFVYVLSLPPFHSLVLYSLGFAFLTVGIRDLAAIHQLGYGGSFFLTSASALMLMRLPFYSEIRSFVSDHANIQRQRSQLEKEAKIGQMISQVSHDLKVPLGMFERMIDSNLHSNDLIALGIKSSICQMTSMIEALKHSDDDCLVKASQTTLDLTYFAKLLAVEAENRGVEIRWAGSSVNVRLDRIKFERAMINVLLNAVQAARSTVYFEIKRMGDDLIFLVRDDGNGVPLSMQDSMFNRGVTFGKAAGTGLGLYFANQVIKGHGGEIKYFRSDEWTNFRCLVPRAFEPVQHQSLSCPAAQSVSHTKILKFGVSLKPETFNKKVLELLRDNIKGYKFDAYEADSTVDVVVTNIQALSIQSTEAGIKVIEFPENTDFLAVVHKIKKRFAL